MDDSQLPEETGSSFDSVNASTLNFEQTAIPNLVSQENIDPDKSVEPNPASTVKKAKNIKRLLTEWIIVLLIAAGIAFITRSYIAQTFFIPSGSMTPTLQVGDRIIVDKLYGTIHVGDIIVFRRAKRDPQVQFPDLVKRVIGLPGQTIKWQGNSILVNGHPLSQPWLPTLTGICATVPNVSGSLVVPKNEYFVMGDCRGDSYDSRYWGPIPASHIIGKVTAIIWRHGDPYFHWF